MAVSCLVHIILDDSVLLELPSRQGEGLHSIQEAYISHLVRVQLCQQDDSLISELAWYMDA